MQLGTGRSRHHELMIAAKLIEAFGPCSETYECYDKEELVNEWEEDFNERKETGDEPLSLIEWLAGRFAAEESFLSSLSYSKSEIRTMLNEMRDRVRQTGVRSL